MILSSSPFSVPLRGRARAPGSVYVFVLMVSMLVGVMGLTGVTLARVRLRAAGHAADSAKARQYARAAIEMALYTIRNESDWRTRLGSSTWFTAVPIADGTVTLKASIAADIDADPTNDDVTLTATATCGDAVHIASLLVEEGRSPARGGWTRLTN